MSTHLNSTIETTLKNLMQINLPQVIRPILGWTAACHLKPRFMELYSQFPLLSLQGDRCTGKTRTAQAFSGLNGAERMDYCVLNSTTTDALRSKVCSPTTVPVVIDECIKQYKEGRKYSHVVELLKTCDAPVCVISEEGMKQPALVDRACNVKLSEEALQPRTHHLKYVQEHSEDLKLVGGLLRDSTHLVSQDWITSAMDRWASAYTMAETPRQSYNAQVINVGLEYFSQVLFAPMLENELNIKL